MVIKLKNIIAALYSKDESSNIFIKVMDSIEDFNRKLELISAVKELNEVAEQYKKEEQSIKMKALEDYCKTENAKNTDKEIKPSDFNMLPNEIVPEVLDRLQKLLDTDITLTKFNKFSKQEIEKSGIVVSDILKIEDFINLN